MTTTLQITGPNFTNTLQPKLPTIANLKTLAFFGSAGDGNNANRVVGGPAIVVQSGAPVYSPAFVNLGLQSARNDVLNTQNPRDATMLAGGFTWAAAARISQIAQGSGGRGQIFGDTNGTAAGASWEAVVTGQNQAILAPGNLIRATISQLISPVANWHFYVMQYTGGAAGTFSLFDFTENALTGVPVTYVASGQVIGAQSLHFGAVTAETLAQNPIEHAFGFDAHSVMVLADLVSLYQWVKANLARRSITI